VKITWEKKRSVNEWWESGNDYNIRGNPLAEVKPGLGTLWSARIHLKNETLSRHDFDSPGEAKKWVEARLADCKE
jgi:hypothetical protein